MFCLQLSALNTQQSLQMSEFGNAGGQKFLPKIFEFMFLNEFVERYDVLSVTNFLNFDLKTLENETNVLATAMQAL